MPYATACAGGPVPVYSPEKTPHPMRGILREAADAGAGAVSTPYPQNIEMCQDRIAKEFAGSFNIPVVFHSQIVAAGAGMDGKKDAALDCSRIEPDRPGKVTSAPRQFAALSGALWPALCCPPSPAGRRAGKGMSTQTPSGFTAGAV